MKTKRNGSSLSISTIKVQSKVLLYSLIFFIVLIGLIIYFSYNTSKQKLLTNFENSFSQRMLALDNSIEDVVKHIKMMKDLTNIFFKQNIDNNLLNRLSFDIERSAEFRKKKNYSFLKKGAQLDTYSNYGTIASSGSFDTDDILLSRLILMSLNLMSKQKAYHKNSNNVVLSYFTHKNSKFMETYPEIKLEKLLKDYKSFNEFIISVNSHEERDSPEKNPEGKHFWLDPYLDPAGHGMMVSCVIPIYDRQKHIGLVGADILLNFLNKYTIPFKNLSGNMVLTTATDQVISATDIRYKNKSKVININEYIPTSKENNENIIYESNLKNVPWTLFYIIKKGTIKTLIIRELKLLFLIIFIFLIFIFSGFFYINRFFVKPGIKAERELKDLNDELDHKVIIRTQELKEREEHIKTTLNSIADAVLSTNISGIITGMNPNAEKILECRLDEVINTHINRVMQIVDAKTGNIIKDPINTFLLTKKNNWISKEMILLTHNGSEIRISTSFAQIMYLSGETGGVVLVFRDITEELHMEEQLAHNRKMDAIGQLAGGVAHDFNNMLSGIIGAVHLLKIPDRNLDSKSMKYVNMIQDASERAADLTSKLLAFGRKGKTTTSPIDINIVIDNTISLFERTFDKKISFTIEKEAINHFITGDKSAIQNIFVNIGINSSHAMPDGGKIIIKTRNVELNEEYCDSSPFELNKGEYIEIKFIDTGSGIPKKILKNIFEPFFTTKKEGKGTGLGLAAVHGTIQEHFGEINVFSEVGKGTEFQVLLPCSADAEKKKIIVEDIPKGSGLILLADDEKIIRETGKLTLEIMGYDVIVAANGNEAVKIYKDRQKEIDLVILDMIMPEMNGSEAFHEIKKIDKNCKIIISSGFTKNENLDALKNQGLTNFIQKPFTNFDLSQILYKELKKDN